MSDPSSKAEPLTEKVAVLSEQADQLSHLAKELRAMREQILDLNLSDRLQQILERT